MSKTCRDVHEGRPSSTLYVETVTDGLQRGRFPSGVWGSDCEPQVPKLLEVLDPFYPSSSDNLYQKENIYRLTHSTLNGPTSVFLLTPFDGGGVEDLRKVKSHICFLSSFFFFLRVPPTSHHSFSGSGTIVPRRSITRGRPRHLS